MELKELTEKEKREINGGDEPAYAIGYALGRAWREIRAAWMRCSAMRQNAYDNGYVGP